MKFLLGVITTLLLIIVISLTAFGVVPVLSPLVGASAKDLGIRVTKEDTKAARTKVGTEIIALSAGEPTTKDYTMEGKQDKDFIMGSKELTAYTNNNPWKNYPIRNMQILIHDDGTLEGSGILVVSKTLPYALALGYSETQILDAMHTYSIPPFEVPFYVTGTGSVTNDQVTVNASAVKIGFVTVPQSIVSQANQEAEKLLEDIIAKKSASLHVENLTFNNGVMHFKGQSPAKEYLIME